MIPKPRHEPSCPESRVCRFQLDLASSPSTWEHRDIADTIVGAVMHEWPTIGS